MQLWADVVLVRIWVFIALCGLVVACADELKGRTLLNLGNTLAKLDRMDDAVAQYQQSYAMFSQCGKFELLPHSLNALFLVYSSAGRARYVVELPHSSP